MDTNNSPAALTDCYVLPTYAIRALGSEEAAQVVLAAGMRAVAEGLDPVTACAAAVEEALNAAEAEWRADQDRIFVAEHEGRLDEPVCNDYEDEMDERAEYADEVHPLA